MVSIAVNVCNGILEKIYVSQLVYDQRLRVTHTYSIRPATFPTHHWVSTISGADLGMN